jgi:UDP-sugar transporter A1/2/3
MTQLSLFHGKFLPFSEMSDNSKRSLLYCSLLSIQFGLQPLITSKFTAVGVSKSSIVIATELLKIFIVFVSFCNISVEERRKALANWNIVDSLKAAALPASLYAVQNLCVQHGYLLLDSMTYNLLNQTKVHFLIYITKI